MGNLAGIDRPTQTDGRGDECFISRDGAGAPHLRVNVFDFDSCLIDENTDRQREAAQSHQVDRLAAEP